MNNLHRELAPISDAAWAQIEEEASRTLKRYLAARRVVDVEGPAGPALSAVGTGHLPRSRRPPTASSPASAIVKPLVELRVPFELDRQQIDDVERGANDSDWQPVKDAAQAHRLRRGPRRSSTATSRRHRGMRQGTSNPIMTLPDRRARLSRRDRPGAEPIASGRRQRPLFGGAGRRRLHRTERDPRPRLPGPGAHQAPGRAARSSGLRRSPARFVLTTRGGDFDLHIGQDISIGYSSHTDAAVRLYLQETFTFLLLTSEAAVALAPPTAVVGA